MKNHLTKLNFPLAVVAHDAGAANIIRYLIKGIHSKKLIFCLEGPALNIIGKRRKNLKNLNLIECVKQSKTLLSGTSNKDIKLEYEARKLAKNNNITSFAVIDHWVNYKERFIRNNLEILPDEIWISDEYALKKAGKCFNNVPIYLIENMYVINEVKKILRTKNNKVSYNKINFLYLLEPIDEVWNNSNTSGDFEALNFFINNIKSITPNNDMHIVLKPHPKEQLDKYDKWCKDKASTYNIYVDKTSTLSRLISWANIVVGCQTSAMIIALIAGKKVICSLPRNAPDCKLPHNKLIHLKDIINN